ncbi:papain-like cysteine protease family protein [Burkholderia ubonensis]|uniref:papain-like cysteine protease family protein n=1 Tax=Burkholderia ubonensis TaxID=101571 RepID=UPI0009B3FADA|nr:papain-like cysteine protease family protein [Burkholderia ubonensis]
MSRPNIRLDVPLVGQLSASDGRQENQGIQPHGQNACWFAAACMVSYYFRTGPRRGLDKIWAKDKGLNPNSIGELATAEGLTILDRPRPVVTAEWLADVLTKHGPIWAGGAFFYGRAHSIVVTGVQDSTVFYNDPWEPREKTMRVEQFESRLGIYKGCLLVKNPDHY